jgi:aspartate/methionine/tyrosine aminotransferase
VNAVAPGDAGSSGGYEPPPYPYDLLDESRAVAAGLPGGAVDLSIGTPCDPVPTVVAEVLGAATDPARSYPPSAGSADLLAAVCGWFDRRLDVALDPAQVGACIGSKELVVGLPQVLRLRDPSRRSRIRPMRWAPSWPAVGPFRYP